MQLTNDPEKGDVPIHPIHPIFTCDQQLSSSFDPQVHLSSCGACSMLIN